jgi:4-coumarate--CoA ligase
MPPHIYPSFYPPLPKRPYCNAFTFAFPPAHEDQHSPETPALIDGATGTTLTRADVRRLALELAFGLTHSSESPVCIKSGGGDGRLVKGDVIMIFSLNSVAFSILAGGFRVTTANSAYTPQELLHQYQDAKPKAIFVHPVLVPNALSMLKLAGLSEEQARSRLILCNFRGLYGPISEITRGLPTLDDLLGRGTLQEEVRFEGPDAEEAAILCYSSGTTGKPKGVVVSVSMTMSLLARGIQVGLTCIMQTSHKNIVAVIRMTDAVGGFWHESGQTLLGVVPLFHVFGLMFLLVLSGLNGNPVVILERFDPEQVLRLIDSYKINGGPVVPPMLIALMRHPGTCITSRLCKIRD